MPQKKKKKHQLCRLQSLHKTTARWSDIHSELNHHWYYPWASKRYLTIPPNFGFLSHCENSRRKCSLVVYFFLHLQHFNVLKLSSHVPPPKKNKKNVNSMWDLNYLIRSHCRHSKELHEFQWWPRDEVIHFPLGNDGRVSFFSESSSLCCQKNPAYCRSRGRISQWDDTVKLLKLWEYIFHIGSILSITPLIIPDHW